MAFALLVLVVVNAQFITDELLDHRLPDAVLLGDDLVRLPSLGEGFQSFALEAVIHPVGAVQGHDGLGCYIEDHKDGVVI